MNATAMMFLGWLVMGSATATSEPDPAQLRQTRQLLAAWHTEDLPNATVWSHHPTAGPVLLWLGQNARLLGERHRALAALQFFPDDAYREPLLTLAAHDKQPALVRSGALIGLRGRALAKEQCVGLRQLQSVDSLPVQSALKTLLESTSCRTD